MIAADVIVSLRRWEAELGRPIGDDELEPRNVAFRRIGTRLSAGDYLASRHWLQRFSARVAVLVGRRRLRPAADADRRRPAPRAGLLQRRR